MFVPIAESAAINDDVAKIETELFDTTYANERDALSITNNPEQPKRKNAFDYSQEEVTKAYETMREKMSKHMKEDSDEHFSGKEYTNAEFLAHMENANWHSELHQLEDANLTDDELTQIKNKTTLSPYGVGRELTGKENVQKMIDSVRNKKEKIEPFSKEDYEERDRILQKRVDEGLITKEDAEYEKAKQAWQRDEITREEFDKIKEDVYSKTEDHTLKMKDEEKQMKDSKGSDSLATRYKGTIDYMKNSTGLSMSQIMEIIKRMDKDRNK